MRSRSYEVRLAKTPHAGRQDEAAQGCGCFGKVRLWTKFPPSFLQLVTRYRPTTPSHISSLLRPRHPPWSNELVCLSSPQVSEVRVSADSSSLPSPLHPLTHVNMATDIDLRAISNFASLPETTINGLLDAPTADAVKSLLRSIEKSAKECGQSKSQKVKLEVELETVVRTNESKVKVLQNSRDKALADVQKLRSEVQTAENNRAQAEADLQHMRDSTSSEASDKSSLKARISSLEGANRDITAALESKTKSYDTLSQDLSAQHQKASDLRQRITALEQDVQAAKSSESSSRFREQSLQREFDQLKNTNEWLEKERTIKAEDHAKFRKDKNARLAELSRSNEQYISEGEALRRSEAALKLRVEELSNKYEDSIQDIAKLQEEKNSEAESYRDEIKSVKRLADLRNDQATTAKDRVAELQQDLEELRDDTTEELGRLRADAQNDHAEKEAAERKINELETTVNQLRSDLDQARAQPSTPQQPNNANGASTPMRPSTPLGIFSPSSSRLKGQPSVTQMFSEYKKLEKELAHEKRINEDLQSNLDAMVQELESSKPELDEIRSDHARVQNELLEMSNLVDQASRERNDAVKEARACQGQLQARGKEVEVLSQQLRDAGSEIRYLLMEQQVREHGHAMSREDFANMQRAADEALSQETSNLSETQQLVNQQLIVFKNIAELQEQNENQLKTIRNLVVNLESTESQERQQKYSSMERELQEAHSHVASLQSELKTMLTQTKSFAREREMFRSMLKRNGLAPGQVTDFSRSLPVPAGGSPARGFDETFITGGGADLSKQMKDLQDTFESHRQEFNTNTTMLRAQVDDLMKTNSRVQTEASRHLGQLTAANQRLEMLQANYNMLKNENSELQKRSHTTSEEAAKQAVKVQQAGEDLVEARGLIDSLRRESANLKAEKDIWKTIETRQVSDIESLRNERTRVDQLNGSLQSLLSEREQTYSEQRRRFQVQTESLETELQTTKRKLNDELEETKKNSQRREYEQDQARKRIDDLMASLSSAREELASAKTSRDHLQARVDEVTVELRSAEERLEVYNKTAVEASGQENGGDDSSITKEEELAIQVSELKRDLELKISGLDRANEQIETYKNIAQEAEERLQETNDTAELYRENTETTITEKDAKIKDLEQRVEDISSELSTTNSELSKLRDEHSGSDRRYEEQKASFEAEIERLKEQEERATENAQFNLEASKAQAEIATQAQQNYENEIVKNAEAIKTAQASRSEANQLRLEMVDLKTQAETAHQDIQQKESSWSERKNTYEQEVADLKQRREEVAQQNAILHGQLESLTKQIAALQRDRTDLASVESTDSHSTNLDDFQEVIKYLRREKEIVDVQYHLSTNEHKRLRQQLDFVQSQLDETRLKLDQQRRAEADIERNSISHNRLMDTLNELNLYRESSVTLRAEAKYATQALSEKTQQVEKLEAQIQPLQVRVSELENLAELRDGELKLLQDDRDHWRQRTQNILSKYDRVDPAELESMKEKLAELERERDEAVSARQSLQTQVDSIPDQVEVVRTDLKNRLGEQFKTRSKELSGRIRDKQAEVDNLTAEKSNLQSELDVVREQLESAHNQSASATQVNGEVAKSPGEVDDVSAELEAKITSLEASIEQKDQEISSLKLEQEQKVQAKEDQLKAILNKRLAEVKQEAQQAKETALGELRQKLESEHQQELEHMRAQPLPVPSELQKPPPAEKIADASSTANGEPSDQVLVALSRERTGWFLNNNPLAKTMVANTIRKKIADGIADAKARFEEELSVARSGSSTGPSTDQIQEMETRFASERETVIQEKEAEFVAEKEQLEKDFESQLVLERQELITQHEAEKKVLSEQSAQKLSAQVAIAEQMAAKKSAFQVSSARNAVNKANAQLKVVKDAATETPTKAVSEVWEVAEKAKPAPAPQPAQPSQPAAALAAPTPQSATPAPQPAAPTQPTSFAPNVASAQPEIDTKEAIESLPEEPKQALAQQAVPNGPAKPNTQNGPNALQKSSGLPQPNTRGGAAARGRGGLPQPQAGRGTGIPRAGGAVRGRGGRVSSVGTAVPGAPGGRGGGAQSPGAKLNPSANQFVPGQGAATGAKRPREEGEGGDTGQKRIRGGGAGS